MRLDTGKLVYTSGFFNSYGLHIGEVGVQCISINPGCHLFLHSSFSSVSERKTNSSYRLPWLYDHRNIFQDFSINGQFHVATIDTTICLNRVFKPPLFGIRFGNRNIVIPRHSGNGIGKLLQPWVIGLTSVSHTHFGIKHQFSACTSGVYQRTDSRSYRYHTRCIAFRFFRNRFNHFRFDYRSSKDTIAKGHVPRTTLQDIGIPSFLDVIVICFFTAHPCQQGCLKLSSVKQLANGWLH